MSIRRLFRTFMGPFHKTRGPGVEGFSLEFLFDFVLLKLLNSTGTLSSSQVMATSLGGPQ